MNETTRAFLTSSITLGGGLITFFIGQIFLKLLDAAIDLRSLIAEVDCDLALYLVDPSIASSQERYRVFKRHSGRLQAAAGKVLGYSYFEDLLRLPAREDVLKAANELLNLAIFDADSEVAPRLDQAALESERNVRKLLRLEPRLTHISRKKGG